MAHLYENMELISRSWKKYADTQTEQKLQFDAVADFYITKKIKIKKKKF